MLGQAVAEAPAGAGSPRRVDKPWGHEIWFAVSERYAGKVLHIQAGHELSLQYHVHKDETIYLLSGELALELEDDGGRLETLALAPGECRRILPGRRHRMRAIQDCQIFEVSTPELDDVVRLEDRYGRAGTSVG
ncbi:MAG: cupin domain-containing protein [Candidatus Dormibacteria bacterium]